MGRIEQMSIKKEVMIGNCRLLLGDCLSIMPTLDKVDAVVTDPPYGIDYVSDHKNSIDYGKIKNDGVAFDPGPFLFAKETIMFGGNNFANRLPVGGWIVWDKRCSFAADKIMGSPFELAWCSKKNLYKIIRVLHGGAKNADALNGDVANAARFHPTQKPVVVMCEVVRYTKGETVFDPFMGSGSTGVACAKLGRKFIGIELEEKYFDIACERIQRAYDQPDLFVAPPEKPTQEGMEF
jgi:site-specific DNA-methyltransferase (adenine-specific)/modification methylase